MTEEAVVVAVTLSLIALGEPRSDTALRKNLPDSTSNRRLELVPRQIGCGFGDRQLSPSARDKLAS